MSHGFEAILFDMDGVLVDSTPILVKAYANTAEHIHLPVPSSNQISRAIRMSPKSSLRYLFNDNSYPVYSAFERYWRYNLKSVSPFQGIPAMLNELSKFGLKVGTVTSRNRNDTTTCLKASGIDACMDIIVTWGDYRIAKPSPACLIVASESLGIPLDSIAYVGDRGDDMRAARSANSAAIGAVWDPFADEDELRLAGAQVVAKEPYDIVEVTRDC